MKNLLVEIVLLITFLSSCQQEERASGYVSSGTSTPISLSFTLSSPFQAGEESASVTTKSVNGPFSVSYSHINPIQTKATTTFANVWVLQFSSNTCVKATNIGTVSTTNINPTLISGSGYTIYIIANGPSSSTAFTTSTTKSSLESTLAYSESIGSDTPYVGKLDNVTISTDGVLNSGSSQAPIMTLTRIAAKISLTLNYNVIGYTLQSVQMYNAPKNMYYVNGSSAGIFPATPSSTDINQSPVVANVIPSTPANGSYIWYVGENKRGTNATITSSYNKDFLHAPTTDNGYYYCTYICVKAKRNDGLGEINYYIYPGGNNTTDFNVIRNYDYNLNVMIQGNAAAQESMEGVDGRVRIASSNCYMVTPGSTITIPVNIKGNANKPLTAEPTEKTEIGGLTHTAASVAVLWQTSSGLINNISNVYNGKVNISTLTTPGNAVVAAYTGANGTGTILWSWHIWVINYKPNIPENGTIYSYNNSIKTSVFMDRSLGALNATPGSIGSFGLFYQWGRKDPFPGANALSLATPSQNSIPIYDRNGTLLTEGAGTSGTGVKKIVVSTADNVLNSIQNPLMFYFGLESNAVDWYSSSTNTHNNSLWSATIKSIYDPCPTGWKVPSSGAGTASPWYKYGAASYTDYGGIWNTSYPGWNFINSVYNLGWFPASGWRDMYNGDLYSVGISGYSHSSSANVGDIFYFAFFDTTVSPVFTGARAHGLPVRCVKE